MRKRLFVVVILIFTIVLATPQVAQTQGESLRDDVKASISLGVDYLKRTQFKSGVWDYQGQFDPSADQVIGCAALCGIALMEAGVPTNDKQIQATANVIRTATSNPRFTYNYGVCLSLLFLDRLHRDDRLKLKHSDAGAIIKLGRLIAGNQCADGGWSYQLSGGGASDNSNTQFAVVALWVARKYMPGGPVEKALGLADKKFRKSQRNDGGWGYDAANIQVALESTGSMTCAGVLGIALHAGARTRMEAPFRGPDASGESSDFYKALQTDPNVTKAKAYLLVAFNDYINNRSKQGHITYFFWSLERVATLYGWKKLDDANTVDWYALGARYLMTLQNKRSGAWNADFLHGPAVDTSFALLFLSKSNLLNPELDAVFYDPGDGSLTSAIPKKDQKSTTPKSTEPKNHEQFAKELSAKALSALANERQNILNELRDAPLSKENDFYTAALVEAISKFQTPTAKEMAREALAGRLRNLPSEKLIVLLNDNNRELRLAAIIAVKLNNNLEAAQNLIPLLADKDEDVAAAALESLKFVSNQDFGKSVDRWNRWLTTVKGKKPE